MRHVTLVKKDSPLHLVTQQFTLRAVGAWPLASRIRGFVNCENVMRNAIATVGCTNEGSPAETPRYLDYESEENVYAL